MVIQLVAPSNGAGGLSDVARAAADDDQPVCPIPANAPPLAPLADFLVDKKLAGKKLGKTEFFDYRDTAGQWVFSTIRLDWTMTDKDGNEKRGKDVFPARLFFKPRTGRLVWKARWAPAPRPLFALEQLNLHPDRMRLLVEGEPKALAVNRLPDSPYVALSFSAGSSSVGETDFSPLADAPAILFADKDAGGFGAMIEAAHIIETVQTQLHSRIAYPVHFVRPDAAWPAKYDVKNLIDEGWDAARLREFIEGNLLTFEDFRTFAEQRGDRMSGGTKRTGTVLQMIDGRAESRAAPDVKQPSPLPDDLPKVMAFDPGQMLPEVLRPWLVDIADRAQACIEYSSVPSIVSLGAVVGRHLGIHPKKLDNWLVVPNLWGLNVGPPGVLKSPMHAEGMRPLRRLEDRARDAHRLHLQTYELTRKAIETEREKLRRRALAKASTLSREDVVEALRELELEAPARRRFIVNDPTVEALGPILNANPAGLLLERDEITGWMRPMERAGHENDLGFYLQCWNGYGPYEYDRILRGTLHIDATCLSVVGGITPGPLGVYLREVFSGESDEGLIQRFQLAVYPDNGSWKNVDREPDFEAQEKVFALFERVSQLLTPSCGEDIPALHFDDEAQEFFDAWRAGLETKVRNKDDHPVMIAHLSKYRSLMPTLALLFHLCETDICEIENALLLVSRVPLKAAQRAALWCDFLESHARRIYYSVTASIDFAARIIGERIKARKLPNPFTARDVYRASWGGVGDRENVTLALELLQDLGWISAEAVPSSMVGGRPTVRYHVNPRVFE
ncbi:MAG: DUF3987 domain-containing protein [Deltaproteobacteria bacterium]|nr:DUF3987 domain-containing protein [Deltaproteobacteria bacterium]